jgi:hypothetical protein
MWGSQCWLPPALAGRECRQGRSAFAKDGNAIVNGAYVPADREKNRPARRRRTLTNGELEIAAAFRFCYEPELDHYRVARTTLARGARYGARSVRQPVRPGSSRKRPHPNRYLP